MESMAPCPASSPEPRSPDGPAVPQRLAARVVLLDPDNRVLLMRYDDGPPNGTHWSTPGGGLEPGETYEQAALRELAEETGWTDIELLHEVHARSHTMEWAGLIVRQSERLFLARTDQPARKITGVDAMHESDNIAAWRWWTLDELTGSTDKIWPEVLGDLIRSEIGRG
jgi:ADP-ribose pyrophosphatase YjhB (NUDIX family)